MKVTVEDGYRVLTSILGKDDMNWSCMLKNQSVFLWIQASISIVSNRLTFCQCLLSIRIRPQNLLLSVHLHHWHIIFGSGLHGPIEVVSTVAIKYLGLLG